VILTATVLALSGYKTFLTSFENFINVLLYFFVPWSVINLIDFYIVRKGRYDVKSFFTPSGSYGGWRRTAIIPYLLALAAQVPFLDQTRYVRPMVSVLGGAGISWLVGFVVAGAPTWWRAGSPAPRCCSRRPRSTAPANWRRTRHELSRPGQPVPGGVRW